MTGFLTEEEDWQTHFIFTLQDGRKISGAMVIPSETTYKADGSPLVLGIDSFFHEGVVYIPWHSVSTYQKEQ